MPGRLTFVMRMTEFFHVPSEDSLSLKLSMPEVVGFLLLLEDSVIFLGLVIKFILRLK